MSKPMLSVSGLTMRFGGINALSQVSFDVAEGQTTSVIGPNGAGKTTLFNCITGMYKPTDGQVRFLAEDITAAPAHRIARHGIARTFQNLALFSGLTVLENLMTGAYLQGSSGLLQGAFLSRTARAERRMAEASAREMLAFLGMEDLADAAPSELSYGRQKQLEFGRALMQRARLVLLDEPSEGVAPVIVEQMAHMILELKEQGVSILLSEQNMHFAELVSDRAYVLEKGQIRYQASMEELAANEEVRRAYLSV